MFKSKPKLNPDEILTAEFGYIAQSAFQANEDRARVASFYFVSVGSLVAAILSTQFSGGLSTPVYLAFAGLFLFLTILGALTIAQLARLRVAWREAAMAMNQIKEYYMKRNTGLSDAFAWQDIRLPEVDKPYSIANLMAIEVALLGAITFGAAVIFLLSSLGTSLIWGVLVSIIFALGCFAVLITFYKHLLASHSEKSSTESLDGMTAPSTENL